MAVMVWCDQIYVTLFVKSSLMLGENKTAFHRKGHIFYKSTSHTTNKQTYIIIDYVYYVSTPIPLKC